jgi:hypothetical protein
LNIEPAEVESLLVSCILDKWVFFLYYYWNLYNKTNSIPAPSKAESIKWIRSWNWTRKILAAALVI